MMLLLALSLQSVPAPAVRAESENSAPEILVIGKKLKRWRGTWKLRNQRLSCKTVISTGDKEVDAIGCTALVDCVSPHTAEFAGIMDNASGREERDRKLVQIRPAIAACTTDQRNTLIAALVAARKARS